MNRILIALSASFALGGCLLSPGTFSSELHLYSDERFSFAYDGEIEMLALSQLAQMNRASEERFEAECYDEDYEVRECSEAEIAAQRAEWEETAGERAAERVREAEMLRQFVGSIDPSDPQAAQEIATRLERQRGWEKVEYRGDGLFDVSFVTAGTLTHDFVFPTVEGMPGANAFVSINLRDGGEVRVDAPAFAAGKEEPSWGTASFAALAAMAQAEESGEAPRIVVPQGTFTIVTDGRILANNTNEGPKPHARGQSLSWTVGPSTQQPPTALVAFD